MEDLPPIYTEEHKGFRTIKPRKIMSLRLVLRMLLPERRQRSAVHFLDMNGRKFSLPLEECRSAESARMRITQEIHLDDNSFDFWDKDSIITSSMWTVKVKAGTWVTLRPSALSRLPLPPPPPASLEPITSPNLPRCLDLSEIWNAEGPFRLPFASCGNRIFNFLGYHGHGSLGEFNLYRKLRERVPAERWSDLNGNLLTVGCPVAPDETQVNIGPFLAKQQDIGDAGFVVIQKGELKRSLIRRETAPHLDGDSVYQWVLYPSWRHAEAGMVRTFRSGYSIVGSWAELRMSQMNTMDLEQFVGQKFMSDGEEFFALISSGDKLA